MADDLEELLTHVPDIDQAWAQKALSHYSKDRVAQVLAKIKASLYPKQVTRNDALLHLHDIFPTVPADTLRGVVLGYDDAPVFRGAEFLLALHNNPPSMAPTLLQPWEMIRSAEYVAACKHQLLSEFRTLHPSTVRAVLAEHNYDYLHSREALSQLASPSWWRPFALLFHRNSSATPPPCSELLEDIQRAHRPSLDKDQNHARQLNHAQYEVFGALIECECCFSGRAWEDLVACELGHLMCRDCLEKIVAEGVYGQGGLRGKVQVQCFSTNDCAANIPRSQLISLPPDLLAAFDDAAASQILIQSRMPLVRCPFCVYAEVDERSLRPSSTLRAVMLLFLMVIFGPLLAVILIISMRISLREYLFRQVSQLREQRDGTMFVCRNPVCGRRSCTACQAEFLPFHKCFEKDQDSLRIYVERACADAVKRTCPRCHLSFIKADGCNKLTCRCGYVMCYICRQDIHLEGYKHFCEHFRDIPGSSCVQCDRCDLYDVEDERITVERAAERARQEFSRSRFHQKRSRLDQFVNASLSWLSK